MKREEIYVYEADDYRLSLEPWHDWHFIHMEVHRWTPRVFKKIQRHLRRLEMSYNTHVFVEPYNRKLYKFACMCGYKYSHSMDHPLTGETVLILTRERTWAAYSEADQQTEISNG